MHPHGTYIALSSNVTQVDPLNNVMTECWFLGTYLKY